ncbi:MAG: hypothetical protein J0L93_04925 [Deltaproteobacteria bacterium]|nr:hypothetical protein [Deltaproteobacteria bacterium]
MKIALRICALFGMGILASACVPKTQFDDQQAKLKEVQEKLRDAEDASNVCDKNTVMQLREQAQSLDLLQQELVDRNTELSKEVARLRVFESQSKNDQTTCEKKLEEAKEAEEARVQRVRATFEDMIKELKADNQKLREALQAKANDQDAKATKQHHKKK